MYIIFPILYVTSAYNHSTYCNSAKPFSKLDSKLCASPVSSLGIIPNRVVGPESDPRGDWPAQGKKVQAVFTSLYSKSKLFSLMISYLFSKT